MVLWRLSVIQSWDIQKQTHRDWNIWIATLSPNVIAVNENSKYNDINELVKGFERQSG